MDDVGFQLAEIATDAWGGADQSARVLDLLAPVGGASAAILTRWDRVARRNTVAAIRGRYPAELVAHLESGDFQRTEPAYWIIRDDPRRPLRCWRDLDEFDFLQSPTARRFLLPAGYRGGMTLRLTSRIGEYVGDLHMSTDAPQYPSPEAMRLLHRSMRVVAAVLQPAVPAGVDAHGAAETLPVAAHAVLVRTDGSIRPVDGGRLRPPLQPGSALLSAVRGRADRLWHWRDERGAWFRVETRAVRGGTTVAAQPVDSARGLSLRELDVLELLGSGLPNLGIARALHLSERTVAHHVERILQKLAVTTRAAAAAVAEREGLQLLR
jgi:DNA-binding CsgD family transcriptional regulator